MTNENQLEETVQSRSEKYFKYSDWYLKMTKNQKMTEKIPKRRYNVLDNCLCIEKYVISTKLFEWFLY